MKIVTPRAKFAAELKPINGWKPFFDRNYGGIEWHHPTGRCVYATPDWDAMGKVTFAASVYENNVEVGQRPIATFRLPTQLNMEHRVGIYQRQVAKVLATV